MATVTERLAFIVSANADQAIKAFEKTANSAEKELGKATKSIDALGTNLTKFGARGLAASGAMLMLGSRFAKAGEDAVASERKLFAVTKTMGLFGDQTENVAKRLITMAEATARNIGVDDEIIQATMTKLMTFKELAKTADKVGGAFDRATMAAIDLAAAGFGEATSNATQLGKALQDPIKGLTALGRAGVTFTADEKEKIKVLVESGKMLEAQNTLLAAVETQVKGVAAASATTSAKVSVAFGEMKESIGKGLLPVFDSVGGGIASASVKIEALNGATGGAVSKFAAFGAIGLGVVSTMSLIAGQTIKMRGRFVDADGAMTKMGKTAKTASLAIAGLAVAESVGAIIDQLGGAARKTEQRLNDLIITAGNTENTKSLTTSFAELADQLKNSDSSITGFFKTWGKAIRVAGADTDAGRIAIEYLDEAFTQIAAKSPALGQKVIDALVAQSAALDKNGDTYKDNMMLVKRYQEQLSSAAGATKVLAEANTDADTAATATAEAAAAAKAKAEAAAKKYNDRIKELRTSLTSGFTPALTAANDKLKEARDKFDSYRQSVSSAVTGSYSFVSALDAIKNAAAGNMTAQDKVAEAQTQLTNSTRAERDAAWALTDATTALAEARKGDDAAAITDAERRLIKANEDHVDALTAVGVAQTTLSTATTAASAATAVAGTTFIDQLTAQANTATQFGAKIDQLLALGISEDSLQLVLAAGAEAGGLIADQLIAGGQQAVDKADALTESVKNAGIRAGDLAAPTFYGEGVKTATALVNGIDAVLKTYKIKLQSKGLTDKQLKKLQKNFKVDIGFEFASREFAIPELAEGGIVPATSGGRIVRVAEAGEAEAIIPLSRFSGAGGGGDVYNININSKIADATLPDLLVAELRKFNRRSGAINIQVA